MSGELKKGEELRKAKELRVFISPTGLAVAVEILGGGSKEGVTQVSNPAFVTARENAIGYVFKVLNFVEEEATIYTSGFLYSTEMPADMIRWYETFVASVVEERKLVPTP